MSDKAVDDTYQKYSTPEPINRPSKERSVYVMTVYDVEEEWSAPVSLVEG